MEHVTVRVRLVEQTQPAAALAGLPNNCIEARQQMEQKNGEWGTKADKRPIASPQSRDWDWGTTPPSLLLESELSGRQQAASKQQPTGAKKKINLQSPLAGMISPASLAIMSRTKTEATEQDCVLADISLSLKVGLGAVLVLRSLYQS
ncbi:hypothetical protein FDECE_13218 [Fusarium decemcellulare]|nr:hypothetical protein FDECE_13218 [Fusarium decemcellulare]